MHRQLANAQMSLYICVVLLNYGCLHTQNMHVDESLDQNTRHENMRSVPIYGHRLRFRPS